MTRKTKALCSGCRNDFYNGQNKFGVRECWSFKTAEVCTRWRIDWWTQADAPAAFQEVRTLSCHHAPGRYAHYKQLPSFAVKPIRRRTT